jgi:hypothetical protein
MKEMTTIGTPRTIDSMVGSRLASPEILAASTIEPITQPTYQTLQNRKASLNLQGQRKAMSLYNAPVVKERYKRVISHFNKPKNSLNG